MARYFFHIFDGKEIFDDVGTELNSVDDLRSHMLKTATAWIEDEANQEANWRLEARDENEQVVGSVQFGVDSSNGAN